MARPKTTPVTVDKICPVCKKTFSVEYRLRNRRTYCSRSCSNHDPKVIEKMIRSQTDTFNNKYGMHPMKTEQTKERFKEAVKEKYGVEWFSSSSDWKEKVKETNIKNHGSEWFSNPEKTKQTCMERYGVSNIRNTAEYKEKYRKTCMERYGVPNASQNIGFNVKHYTTMFERFLNHPKFSNFKPLFSFEEYSGVFVKKYKFECKRCGSQKEYSIDNGKSPVCVNCDKCNSSFFQKEVYDYIESILGKTENIVLNNRTILYPKELDVVIPNYKIAIECNGLVWHSEIIGRKNKVYHLLKTKSAAIKGYRLIHIFDCEWENKQDIIKSIIATSLKKTTATINGRDCIIKEISSEVSGEFLKNNHLQGGDHSTVKLGLFFENELLSVMTFVRSRFDAKIEWEMSRYCNKLYTIVHGGASKLFTHFIKTYSPNSVVSYSDRRFFDGMLYLKLGFQFVHNSTPNYFYIIDNYLTIQHRMGWQKHKLQEKLLNFDPKLSEWENMKNNGFDRVWDCGHSKWIWSRK